MISPVGIKQKLFLAVEIVHLRIFGHEMGEEMRKFLGNLGISFFGGTISSLLLLAVSVLAGRFLGPADYGKYALYVALYSFLTIFLSFGLETTIVRLAANADKERRRRILSTYAIFFFANSIFWSFVFLVFSDLISKFFGLPTVFIVFALLFSMTNALAVTIENYLKLLNQFIFVNVVRVFQGIFLLFSIIALYFLFEGVFSLGWFVALNVFALILVLIVFLFETRSYFTLVFDKGILKELLSFSSVIFLGVISGYLIQNGTSILIDKFIGSRELGFYSAYYTLSALATGQFIVLFSAVYFPAVAQAGDKSAIARKIDRIFPALGIGWFILSALVIFFGMKLYGREYSIDYMIVLFFSAYSLFNLYGSLFGFIVISGGKQEIVRNLFIAWFFVVALYFVFLITMGMTGSLTLYMVVAAYATIFFVNAILNKYFCNKYISSL